jgi:4-amino-4-deoxy-L-arabinose transferase-like glycosyltransferase
VTHSDESQSSGVPDGAALSREAWLFLIVALALQLVLFVLIARHRFVDTDEGFYLLASRLVLLHKKPYLDFFFQQAPLLPYVYAAWLKCFGVTWQWARLLPALLTTLLGCLIYVHVSKLTNNVTAGLAAIVLFGCNTLVFAWMPIAKPYSLAGLLLFGAYLLVSRPPDRVRWVLAIGGLSLALAVDTRSYLVLTLPVFLWWILRNTPEGWKASVWFLAGFAIGLLPSLYFFLSSPTIFVFDNLGYHAIRTNEGLVGMWGQKLIVLLMLLLGGPEGNGIQTFLLLAVTVGFWAFITERDSPARFAFQLSILIAVISLLPTPVLPQYFAFCIPFLIVSATCVANGVIANLPSLKARSYAFVVAALVLALYVFVSLPDFRKYLVTGDGIPTVRWAKEKNDWKIDRVVEVSLTLNKLTGPGEVVASFWPGYLFESDSLPFPGLETDCGILIANKLTPAEQSRYHVISWGDFASSVADHTPRVVVMSNHYNHESALVPIEMGDATKALLMDNGYRIKTSAGDTSIYLFDSEDQIHNQRHD